ncbi:MAG TPA: MauE/DoxX family redox-associated membrane protein [Candidatus Acidoferrales bacterium]|nr:MauE/DoxX family redox-associated membrane protein [Candidatus Acidoferrales bacterium]
MRRALLVAGRLALGLVFLYAAYGKLRPPIHPAPSLSVSLSLFAMQIDSYQLLPVWAVTPLARALPFLELILGALLLIGYRIHIVAAATSALLLVFFGVMLRTYFRGLEINCGCFGPGETLSVKTLMRDGLLLGVSLAVTATAFLSGRAARAPQT